ncbi:sugar-binding transcriptional regulator [Lysinibacter cavernae]|uniref:DNA-binding transcriptional regulator LsrR (DeoR family) n=1 Tax=Lysinibacter cavernae TaxID=1640652 RepID=A0A7X5TT52_9MICO|nr:sugar-binding domain-containing protein [Lysinibacter cavernae]NIH53154.1 DNA-binding transcriptional regulator LsrR (DeoR family) [Lysinibacter cavernae]
MARQERFTSLTTAMMARRYYLEGATKNQIAQEFGVSRFKVARQLDLALQSGIVTITIAAPPGVNTDLSARLAAATGLRQAIVVQTPGSVTELTAALGSATATLLADTLDEDDVLGITWGATLSALVEALPELPPFTAVQLAGSLSGMALTYNAPDLLRRIQQRTHGQVFPLHAPLVLGSAAAAQAFLADPEPQHTFSQFGKLTHAVVGVGSWLQAPELGGTSSLVQSLTAEDFARFEQLDAKADIAANVFNSAGALVQPGDFANRSVGITAAQLRAVPDVIAVAGGEAKAEAIAAVLRSGIIHRLVTDEDAALAIIRLLDAPTKRAIVASTTNTQSHNPA